MQLLIYTTLYYGLRRSEVLNLKWNTADFENDSLEIKNTVVKHTTIVAKGKIKTAAGNREHFTSRNKEITEKQKNIR